MAVKQFEFWGKSCSGCGREKNLEEFPKNKDGLHGRHSHCKECHNANGREKYSEDTPSRPKGYCHRSAHLKRAYGISVAQYDELLEKQNHCCAICNKHEDEEKKNFSVDHDHISGEIRGLLCAYCNHRVVGRHRDGALLRKIADYVEQGTGWFVPKRVRKRKRK